MLSAGLFAGLFVLYWVWTAIYRLYLSPLAKIPGPKIAALTTWYCAYHDIIRGGQYIWVVEEMHRKYGPIVRTMPGVVHVNDPAFIEKLYTLAPNVRRERGWPVLNMFGNDKAMLPTRDHDLHRRRRAVISRYFSQQNVRRLVPFINDTLGDLLERFDKWAEAGDVIKISMPYRAATKDVIQSYAFGEGEKCLSMPDCNAAFFAIIETNRLVHISVHLPAMMAVVNNLPEKVAKVLIPTVGSFIQFLKGLTVTIEGIRNSKEDPERRTIFHEILHSDISEQEKSTSRMVDEAMVLAIAGADTTAATLEALTYHVLSDREIFKRLRAELDQAIPDPTQFPDPTKLDNLPFLNALIEETLRLYPSATHRQDRLAPDEDLVYQYSDGRSVTIPRGTVVGMTAILVNRSPLWYENPDEFRPERYIENPKSFKRMLTFSKGARQCLGINLAYQELQTFTAGIFRKYRPYDPELKEQSGPTLELHETTVEDVKTYADYVTPGLRPGSKGVQVRIRRD
ncbi:unnamed protein product [Clonostachys byssicola]|uniref:Cytochrome P450 n=1 Tax=Clonostachys byssicola TaxID=160290 RepID=A0A9N9UNT9_9HYPO|nr:unnamed protein product [Clonostachys byssicola]